MNYIKKVLIFPVDFDWSREIVAKYLGNILILCFVFSENVSENELTKVCFSTLLQYAKSRSSLQHKSGE